jgi:hypothetical protein
MAFRSLALLCLALGACFSLRALAPDAPPIPAGCGNGKRDAGEDCDGDVFAGSRACVVDGQGAGGVLACTSTCQLDVAGCVLPSDDHLRLWLRADASDPPGLPLDHADAAVLFTFTKDGVAQPGAATILSLSPTVAVPSTTPQNDRAFEVAPGAGHAAFDAAAISVATPITYELWIAPTDATPDDREGVIFAHENACTLSLVAGLKLRASCGSATVDHTTALVRNQYTFVSVAVGRATLTLWASGSAVSASGAPIEIGTGRFAFANSLTPADGATKQFIGRIDDLRIFGETRDDDQRCTDSGAATCP